MSGKTMKVLAVIAAGVIVVCIAVVVTLRVLFPPEKIKSMVIPQVEKVLGRDVTVDKARISIVPVLGVSLTGLRIAETERAGFDSTDFVSVGEIEVGVSLMPLLRREIDITKIRILRPFIRVQVHPSGAYNFDDMAMMSTEETTEKKEKPSAGPALPLPVSLRKLTIIDGVVEYTNAKSNQHLSIGSINQHLAMNADRKMENIVSSGEILLSDITLNTGETPKPISGLTFTLRHDVGVNLAAQRMEIKSVRLSVQDVYMNASGTVASFMSQPSYEIVVTTDTLALEKLIAAVPTDLVPALENANGSGSLYLSVAAQSGTGSPSGLSVSGTCTVSNGAIQYPGLPESIHDITMNADFTMDKLIVSPLSLKLGKNPVSIQASVEHFDEPVVDAKVDARIDLGDLKNMVELPPDNALDGMVEAAISASGPVDPSDPSKLDLQGAIQLSKVMVRTPALAKPAFFDGKIDLTAQRISPNMTINIASSKLSLNADVNNYLTLIMPDSTKIQPRPNVNFRLASSSLNTNEFLPKNETEAAEKTAAERGSDAQPPSLLLPAPLPGIDMNGKITTGELRYEGFELNNLTMDYTMVNDIMTVTTKTGVFDGSFAQSLTVDAGNIHDLKVKSSLTMQRVEINRVIAETKSWLSDESVLNRQLKKLDRHLYGKSNMSIEFVSHGGTMQELTKYLDGTVRAELSDGRISGGEVIERIGKPLQKLKILTLDEIQFRTMKFTARIKDEKVYLDNLYVGSPGTGDWNAEGVVGFNGSIGVDLTNRLPIGISRTIAKGKNFVASKAKSAMEKTALAPAAGLVDNVGPRPDKQGRYTVRTTLAGALPGFSVKTFQFVDGDGSAKTATPSIDRVKQKARDAVKERAEMARREAEKAKKEAERKLKEAKEKAEAEAKKELEEKKKKAEEEAKRKVEEGKKKAWDALKKRF
jgi:hypothetical protein